MLRARETDSLTQLAARPDARPALDGWLRDHGTLSEAAAAQPGAEVLTGRGRVHVAPSPVDDGRWAVRHYHRGGVVAPLLRDRYLRVGTPRPVRELHLGWALEERGLPTPAHIAAAVYPAGPWYRGDLVTRYVPASRDLAAVLFPGRPVAEAEALTALEATGRLFRTLHDGGVIHPDLNLKNVLIVGRGPSPGAQVLDLDGARLQRRVGHRARRRMIERFWRSGRKWSARTGTALDPTWRDAFQTGYDSG